MSQEVAESSKNEHEMTMKYWYLTGDNVNDLVVHGAVHGNPKFTDGTRIHTSTIMEFHHAGADNKGSKEK